MPGHAARGRGRVRGAPSKGPFLRGRGRATAVPACRKRRGMCSLAENDRAADRLTAADSACGWCAGSSTRWRRNRSVKSRDADRDDASASPFRLPKRRSSPMSLEGRTIALIEDDPIMGESLVDRLSLEGAKVLWWQSCGAAAGEPPEPVRRISSSATSVCPTARARTCSGRRPRRPDASPFLFVTGYGDIDQAVRLMRNGAGDYMTKPFEMTDFLSRVETAPAAGAQSAGLAVLGVSAADARIESTAPAHERAQRAGPADGRDRRRQGGVRSLPARSAHARSPGPFIAVNCAAIPKDLMESELFGHEKGAFTGATSRHLGYAERARDGILVPRRDRRARPEAPGEAAAPARGSDRSTVSAARQRFPSPARLVCATNADLTARVKAGSFREDLFYRINVLAVSIPPLRERPGRHRVAGGAVRRGVRGRGRASSCRDSAGSRWRNSARMMARQCARTAQPDRARGRARAGPVDHARRPLPGPVQKRPTADDKTARSEAARDEAERREILRALRQQRRGHRRGRSGARHLPHHHVGEDAPARHRAGFCQLEDVRISEHSERTTFGFPNDGLTGAPCSFNDLA